MIESSFTLIPQLAYTLLSAEDHLSLLFIKTVYYRGLLEPLFLQEKRLPQLNIIRKKSQELYVYASS